MATRPHWLLGIAVLAALAFASGGPAMAVEPCKASQLTGTFKVILGSPGAGSISYRLRLTNTTGPTTPPSARSRTRRVNAVIDAPHRLYG